jgi:hypothetical protein
MDPLMYAFRRFVSVPFALCAIAAYAQSSAQDGIEANKLERSQREAEFHVRLYDATIPQPSVGPRLPLPLESAPRSTLHLSEPLPPNPTTNTQVVPQGTTSADRARQELNQQQRLQQLQTPQTLNRDFDETVRQQQLQIQQLQFDRENSAQSLHDRIMRDSQGAMRQAR